MRFRNSVAVLVPFSVFLAFLALSGCSRPLVKPADAPAPQAQAPAQPPAQPKEPPPGMVLLPTVAGGKLTGLDHEDPALVSQMNDLADEYFDDRRALAKSCREEAENPFCALISRQEQHRKHAHHGHSHHLSRAASGKLARLFRKADLVKLNNYSEGELNGALKNFHDSRAVAQVAKAALAAETCPSTALLSALGLRTERDLPDAEAHERVSALYERSLKCGDDFPAMRAGYRLGLLRIWEGKLVEADQLLARVALHPDAAAEFRARSLYWRFHIARETGNAPVMAEMRAALVREAPLSLHALFVSPGSTLVDQPIVNKNEPFAAFRSKAHPELNATLLAAEILQEREEEELSFELLDASLERLKTAEPEVQLYASVLLMRAGDVIKKFQLMTSLFHEHPEMISRGSLEMLYPLHRFASVERFENKVDPYLVLSLMRQESAFNDHARSSAGALGLMQLMPKTARKFERVSRRQLLNPDVNIRIGVKYFSRLLDRFDGDAELALAAYNAGPERIDDWCRRYPVNNRLLFLDLVPFRETREYVASIARNYFWYLKLYQQEGRAPAISAAPGNVGSGTTVTAASGSQHFQVFGLFKPTEYPKPGDI